MLNLNGKDVVSMMADGKMLSAMYRNGRLIWQAITHLSAWFRSEGYFRSEPW